MPKSRRKVSGDAPQPPMFQIHTRKDTERVRDVLRQLVTDSDRASGKINGNTFCLYPKPMRRGTPVILYGRISPDRDGSLIRVWPFPHWSIAIFVPIWAWFGRQRVHAPWWFVLLGLAVCIVSFIIETRRGCLLLRENMS